MKVYELIKMLSQAPHDMEVYLLELTEMDGFCFKPACPDNSGIMGIGNPDEYLGEHGGEEQQVFAIAPHGKLGYAEDEEPDDSDLIHKLN